MGVNPQTSQSGRQGSAGDTASGERNELRAQNNQPTVQEELMEIVEEYELNKRIEEIKARKLIYRRQKK